MADEPTVPAVPPPPQSSALARPSFIPPGSEGTEHMSKDDFQIPRLGLAQALSKEVQDGDAKFIDGLRVGMFFNNLTGKIFEPAKGPLYFTILRADPPRYIQFRPRSEGGGVVDMNVPANDPRTRFTRDADGKSVPPIATKFYDYVVFMLTPEGRPLNPEDEMDNVIGLSLKGSGIKTARTLNGLMKYRNAPMYSGKYEVSSAKATGPKGEYFVYNIGNAKNPIAPNDKAFGWLPDEAMFAITKGLSDSLKDKTITMDRDTDTDFDPEEMEGKEAGGGRM